MNDASAGEIIARLGLIPHAEGGHYRETFRHRPEGGERGAVTVIYYLLCKGERSAWHRIDATEVWHFYAGAPLELLVADEAGRRAHVLGIDFRAGMSAHAIVPARAWQSAQSLGGWTLVGCTVAPAFEFPGFELAPPEWTPP